MRFVVSNWNRPLSGGTRGEEREERSEKCISEKNETTVETVRPLGVLPGGLLL